MTRVVKALTNERHKTHGRFEDVAATSESLLKVMQASVNWSTLSPQRREAVKMITHKLARIGAGNPAEPDHWDDIGGYAELGKNDGQTAPVRPVRKAAAVKKRVAKKVAARPAKKAAKKKLVTKTRTARGGAAKPVGRNRNARPARAAAPRAAVARRPRAQGPQVNQAPNTVVEA